MFFTFLEEDYLDLEENFEELTPDKNEPLLFECESPVNKYTLYSINLKQG
jgi:hypothetical protein